jgi:hypothetical protein
MNRMWTGIGVLTESRSPLELGFNNILFNLC